MKEQKGESQIVPLSPEPDQRFEVTDENSANWVVRKIIESGTYVRRVKSWADMEIRRAQREEAFFRQRFGPQLEAWLQQQLAGARRKVCQTSRRHAWFPNRAAQAGHYQ